MIFSLVDEAVASGARKEQACKTLGLCARSVQRWRKDDKGEDQRHGPKKKPKSALSELERQTVLSTVNQTEYRNVSPKQIVPKLAQEGEYIGSESTVYRILRQEKQLTHRQRSQPPKKRTKPRLVANGPNEVYTWDITYLRTTVRGMFFYLYLVVDMWSRKIVGWTVEESESMELSSALIQQACDDLGVDPKGIVLHADNGGPMKGSTMLATLQRLGIVASFSRPRVSDDNPFSEALFRTLKYRPEFPSKPFTSVDQARQWVEAFVIWYNTCHLHSSIRYVTPDDRHFGREADVLARRQATYEEARRRHPERWSGSTRDWSPVGAVYLNADTEVGDAQKYVA